MLPFYYFCWIWVGVSSLDRAQLAFACSKPTIRTSEQYVKYVIDVVLVSSLLILNILHTLCRCFRLLNLNKKISAEINVWNLVKSNWDQLAKYLFKVNNKDTWAMFFLDPALLEGSSKIGSVRPTVASLSQDQLNGFSWFFAWGHFAINTKK